MKHSPLDIAGFIFGCITIAMLVVTACYAQEINGHWADTVLVYSEDSKGWHTSPARLLVCAINPKAARRTKRSAGSTQTATSFSLKSRSWGS